MRTSGWGGVEQHAHAKEGGQEHAQDRGHSKQTEQARQNQHILTYTCKAVECPSHFPASREGFGLRV
eukprot:356906-Chlamydomonas_euryale.AAC.1